MRPAGRNSRHATGIILIERMDHAAHTGSVDFAEVKARWPRSMNDNAALLFVRSQAAFDLTIPNRWLYSCVTRDFCLGGDTGRSCDGIYLLDHSRVGRVSYSFGAFRQRLETKMGADKLSRMKLPHHSSFHVDLNLKLVSERSCRFQYTTS